ncbi:hypothetical protein BDV06DRAFT_227051 [Aspergillus oleicola]
MVSSGLSGQFDTESAAAYAIACHDLGYVKRKLCEWPRLRAQTIALTKVPEGRVDDQKKFMRYLDVAVAGFVAMDADKRNDSFEEKDRIFSRYAAFLNYIHVIGGWSPGFNLDFSGNEG